MVPTLAGQHSRDLDADLRTIRDFGAVLLITLMEMGELDWAGTPLPALAARARAFGLRSLYLPIVDGDAPDAHWEDRWREHGPVVHQCLQEGKGVVVHCRGGRGRAGLVAARLLVELGHRPADAVTMVRNVRAGAIETEAQESYITRLRT